MAKTKIIIAGAGIAGPVLAMFLKAKGYEPVVYERSAQPTSHGLSLALQTNGMRVLSLIPGLLDKIVGGSVVEMVQYSVLAEDLGELSRTDMPGKIEAVTGFGVKGVRRTVFHRTLLDHAESLGIPIVFSHQLVAIQEEQDSVIVTFANGKTDTASFVVGCDGLHSNTRECLFGKQEPSFTGLVQTGGLSETPEELRAPRMVNWYGDGAHMIAYPANDHLTSWAITTQEVESKETWRAMDEEAQQKIRDGLFSQWPYGAGKLVKSGTNIVKYGLYDRPELESWHKGRIVLLGDAAHPTSPHLGQGANQAFEDIYHLVRLLVKYNPEAGNPPTTLLTNIFTEYESARISRTSALVKRARKQGEIRVVSGAEKGKKRNDQLRTAQGPFTEEIYREIMQNPFEVGHSEISL
ncbi:FAD/NAD-P-binding domain-containing protein [Trametes coccinea BRFM310]|uniref:FAD/NAD-P-binding domain-containing protein n=1 Tax=Trametes coccinea (strain BRFM310) TaxID=1353009 RepID=A0A1Y2IS16_TRAC3|nr:FAD/NAD-P-binding domain-containing protein [Trametes coccinea BRFM310]